MTAPRATTGQAALPTTSPAGEPLQVLTFVLAGETYAIGILAIREIIEYHSLTAVPMMPACVRGVINLRGAVVPVMDLQARFGRAASPVGKKTCIVIVEVQGSQDRHVLGVVVDAVNEVLDIDPVDIEPPPSFGSRIRAEFIQGMGKVKGRFVILLDVDRALSVDGLGAVPTDAPVPPESAVSH